MRPIGYSSRKAKQERRERRGSSRVSPVKIIANIAQTDPNFLSRCLEFQKRSFIKKTE